MSTSCETAGSGVGGGGGEVGLIQVNWCLWQNICTQPCALEPFTSDLHMQEWVIKGLHKNCIMGALL